MSEDVTLDEFVETESDGEETQEWKTVKLEDVAWKRSENVDPEEVNLDRHVGLEHIEPNTPKPDWESVDGLSSTKRCFKPGDILFAKLRPNLEKSAQPDFEGVASTDIFPIVAEQAINNKYLLYRLSSKPAYDHARRTSVGTRMPRTSWNLFSNFEFEIPPIIEQRKIASILYNVDQAIQKTEEIIKQTQRLRKGVMQELFSYGVWSHTDFQETQYGTIPAEWEVRSIRKIASRIGSGGTPDTDKDEYYGGKIAWVKTDDLNSGLVNTTKTTITKKGLRESAAKLFPEGTVVFAMYGGALGQNGRLGMEAAMNQACCGIVTDNTKIEPYFLHQQLIHRKQQLTALSAGTHQQNISQSMIEKFEVFTPSLEEQREMVEILSDIEYTIDKNYSEKERLKRLKQGLMQDLLSGTVRTTDTNIEVLPEVAQHG